MTYAAFCLLDVFSSPLNEPRGHKYIRVCLCQLITLTYIHTHTQWHFDHFEHFLKMSTGSHHVLPGECFQHQINSWPRRHVVTWCYNVGWPALLHYSSLLLFFFFSKWCNKDQALQCHPRKNLWLKRENTCVNISCCCFSHLWLVFSVSWLAAACVFLRATHTKELNDAKQPEHSPGTQLTLVPCLSESHIPSFCPKAVFTTEVVASCHNYPSLL